MVFVGHGDVDRVEIGPDYSLAGGTLLYLGNDRGPAGFVGRTQRCGEAAGDVFGFGSPPPYGIETVITPEGGDFIPFMIDDGGEDIGQVAH